MATYEIPYGAIERPTTRNNSWEKAKFEVPALRWADLGDGQHGFSLINEAKYGYDGAGNVLRLSLLRSPTSPDPEADQGAQHFTYALYPHAGDWKQAGTVHHGYEFNYPLAAAQVAAHAGLLPPQQRTDFSHVRIRRPARAGNRLAAARRHQGKPRQPYGKRYRDRNPCKCRQGSTNRSPVGDHHAQGRLSNPQLIKTQAPPHPHSTTPTLRRVRPSA
jgi:hypothetical protein